LLYAVLGDLEKRRSNLPAAANYFRKALDLTTLESERAFLNKQIGASEN